MAEWAAFASLCTGPAWHAATAVKNHPRPASPGLGAASSNGKLCSLVQLSSQTRHLISAVPARPEPFHERGGGRVVRDRNLRLELSKYNDMWHKLATYHFISVESTDVTSITILWWVMNISRIYPLTHYYSRRTAGIFVRNTTESQIPDRQLA